MEGNTMSLDILLEPVIDRSHEKLPCKVGRILASLDDPYKTALVTLLGTAYSHGGLSDEALTERIKLAGFPVGASVVNRHRRNKCACE
jgi:hypothetical protein